MIKPLIGGHVSAAGGHYTCFENAKKIGAETIQIFGASPRQWSAKIPDEKSLKKYFDAKKNSDVQSVYLHAAYLVNLASPDNMLIEKSLINLSAHLQICELLRANGLIFHIGSGKDLKKSDAIKKVAKGMKKVLKNIPGKSLLIMENTAGGGNKIGSDLKEIGEIFRNVNSKRVKVCIDTAHAFEVGNIDEYTPKKIKNFFDEFERVIGLKNLECLHINDSKTQAGSQHDRHENIGKGFIGIQGFKSLAYEKRLMKIPWLLEVPGFDNQGPDKKNIQIVRKLFS